MATVDNAAASSAIDYDPWRWERPVLSLKGKSILSSATQMFSLRGYDAASMHDISTSAGCTKATVYAIFGSKRGLFMTSLSEVVQRLPPPSGIAAGSSWRIDLRFRAIAWRLARMERGRDCRAIIRMLGLPMVEAEIEPCALFSCIFSPYKDAVQEAISDAKMRGYMSVDDPARAASQLVSLIGGYRRPTPISPEPVPWRDKELKAHIDNATAFFLAAHAVKEGQWDHLLYP